MFFSGSKFPPSKAPKLFPSLQMISETGRTRFRRVRVQNPDAPLPNIPNCRKGVVSIRGNQISFEPGS